MNLKFLFINAALLLGAGIFVQAQTTAPTVHHSGLYGGSQDDHGRCIVQTGDNGFVMGGWANSSDGQAPSSFTTLTNALVVRTDASGNYLWSTVIAGSKDEDINAIAVSKGKVIVSGNSRSIDGDFAGMASIKGFLAWIDSANGHLLRVKSYGGNVSGTINKVKVLTGGKLLVCGAQSNIGSATAPTGSYPWTALMDDTGKIIWQRYMNAAGPDLTGVAHSVVHRMDGGFTMLAEVSSAAVIPGLKGVNDFALVSMDDTGKVLWVKYFGGSQADAAVTLIQTQDGGFICGGSTKSSDGDVKKATHGDWDYWVFKTDKDGNILWQKTIGGSKIDLLFGLAGTCNNGSLVYGMTMSNDGDAIANTGMIDLLVLRLDDKGDTIWTHCYGSSQGDFEGGITVTSDDGYAFVSTSALADRDVSGSPHGSGDYWLAVLKPDGLDNNCPLKTPPPVVLAVSEHVIADTHVRIYPNPVQDQLIIESLLPVHATLTDLLGRELMHTEDGRMAVGNLASGLYLISCTDLQGNRIGTYKVQKEH
ncbi:MAG: T9SS type A sorting domain-containing protein [Bacteroidota bacterium]